MDKKSLANSHLNNDSLFSEPDLVLENLEPSYLAQNNLEIETSAAYLISDENLFGAEIQTLENTQPSYWTDLLNSNHIFDADLAYSSHEIIHLNGDSTLFDDSPSQSVIFIGEGLSEIITGKKQADIFLQPDGNAILTGQNGSLNIFIDPESASNLELEGEFGNLSLNFYQDTTEEVVEYSLRDGTFIYNNSDLPLIDFQKFNYNNSVIEVNVYGREGLISSEKLGFDGSVFSQEIEPASIEAVSSLLFASDEVLFPDEINIPTPQIEEALYFSTSAEQELHIESETGIETYNELLENQSIGVFEETISIIEAGSLFENELEILDGVS